MKKKIGWGNCSRCGIEITDSNFGDCIDATEVYVCDSCARKHMANIIAELEKFRKSKDFNNILDLKKNILWTSEKMGNWHDNADKSYMESITDYDDWTIKNLQTAIINNEITILENLLYEDILEEKQRKFDKKDKEFERLRIKLVKLLGYLDSL